jgi:hypothetical protein
MSSVTFSTSIDEMLKDKIPELPGVVRSVAEREFRLAMREFFERSWALLEMQTSLSVPGSPGSGLLVGGSSNLDVIGILAVWYGSDADGWAELKPLGHRPVRDETADDPDSWYVMVPPDTIQTYPYTSSPSGSLRALTAVTPDMNISSSATAVPRQVEYMYYDAIMNGFLSRMYMQPNKPYTNPVLGQQLRHNFLRQIGYYSAQRKKGYNGTPAWTYPNNGWNPRKRGLTSRVG